MNHHFLRDEEDEAEHREALNGADWSFIGACVTIALIGLAALAGWAYKRWPWL